MAARGFVETVRDVLFSPRVFFSAEPAERSRMSPTAFAALVALVTGPAVAVVNGLWEGAEPGAIALAVVVGAIRAPIALCISLWISAAFAHVVLRMLGGARKPYSETLACFGYAVAPMPLSVIPVLGVIAALVWQLVVGVIALGRVHGSGTLRACVAMLASPVVLAACALGLRFGVLEAFKIPSGSMTPTLMIGDHMFINKYVYRAADPERGDVVVFHFPENRKQDFVKRVIAQGGDDLAVVDGRPVVNGTLAPHCYVGHYESERHGAELYVEYLSGHSYLTQFDSKLEDRPCKADATCDPGHACRGGVCGLLQGPYHVPPGEFWVLGDNRNNSHDSRSWAGGRGAGVPRADLVGRAMFIWMSFSAGGSVAKERLWASIQGPPELPAEASSLRPELVRCLETKPPSAAQPTQ